MTRSPVVGRLILALLVVLCATGRAFAQSDPLASDLKKSADEAMVDGRYEAALEAYTRALAIEETTPLHYNRGRALQALERYAEALAELERFARDADASLRSRVPDLDALLGSVRRRVAILTIVIEAEGAVLDLGTGLQVPLPVRGMRVNAGTYHLTVTAPGYETQERVTILEGGKDTQLDFKLIAMETRAVLEVTSNTAGAEVWMGDQRLGNVPLELPLGPGEYQLALKHPKRREVHTRVVLNAREHRHLNVDMDGKTPVYKRWWFWTAGAVVVAGAVTAAVLATRPQDPKAGDIEPGILSVPLRAQSK